LSETVLPNDIISGKCKYVIGSDLSPVALIYHDSRIGVVIDLTTVASSPDQRPKTDLKSNSDVFTDGDFEIMVSNESLTGSNPTIYSAKIKITNISGATDWACISSLYVKDPEGFIYDIDRRKSSWPTTCGDLYPGEKMGGMSVFPVWSNPDQIMLVFDTPTSEPINSGLRLVKRGETSSPPTPTPVSPTLQKHSTTTATHTNPYNEFSIEYPINWVVATPDAPFQISKDSAEGIISAVVLGTGNTSGGSDVFVMILTLPNVTVLPYSDFNKNISTTLGENKGNYKHTITEDKILKLDTGRDAFLLRFTFIGPLTYATELAFQKFEQNGVSVIIPGEDKFCIHNPEFILSGYYYTYTILFKFLKS
jgi:hypothetical protein